MLNPLAVYRTEFFSRRRPRIRSKRAEPGKIGLSICPFRNSVPENFKTHATEGTEATEFFATKDKGKLLTSGKLAGAESVSKLFLPVAFISLCSL